MPDETFTYHRGARLDLVKESAEKSSLRDWPAEAFPSVEVEVYRTADTRAEFLVTNRLFVRFRHTPGEQDLGGFARSFGLKHIQTYEAAEHFFEIIGESSPLALVKKLTEDHADQVELAEHDLIHRLRICVDYFPLQWHLHRRMVHPYLDRRAPARCEEAWDLLGNKGDPRVTIGITDNGCRMDHPDFDSQGKFAAWAFVENDVLHTSPQAAQSKMYQSEVNHGTYCAGVAAAEFDQILTVGAAPNCRLLPVRWPSQGDEMLVRTSSFKDALIFVNDKVDVLSNSWGSSPFHPMAKTVTDQITKMAKSGGRRKKGIVFVWAAGNNNCPLIHSGQTDVPYDDGHRPDGSWKGVATSKVFRNDLAALEGVMHIAALASTARRSHYSNYGTGVTLCAPSSNWHTYRRLSLDGLHITTASGNHLGVDFSFGGTSAAAPLVAGIAALVISANEKLTAPEVISILKRTAEKNLDFTPYQRTPGAPFDPKPTWDVSPVAPFDNGAFQNSLDPDGTWSPWFGHGRVDAAEPVREALRRR
jgi:subtilisin family serine protease